MQFVSTTDILSDTKLAVPECLLIWGNMQR